MPKNNNNPSIWGYLRLGDIVKDFKGSIFFNTTFEIIFFHGNCYCPMISTNICDKYYRNGNPKKCNLDARNVRLVDAPKRPFRKLNKVTLCKLVAKGNIEAKREFKIRVNTKTL